MSHRTKLFIGVTVAAGIAALAGCLLTQAGFQDPSRFVSYLALAGLASMLKLRLPRIQGTISLNFLLILIALVQLTLAETALLGAVATLVQCLWRARTRPKLVQVLFNVSALIISISIAYPLSHLIAAERNVIAMVALGASMLFVMNTGLIAVVLSLIHKQTLRNVWTHCYLWTFPYYLVGAGIAAAVTVSSRFVGWKPSLLVLPLMYLVYLYYRFYLSSREAREPSGA